MRTIFFACCFAVAGVAFGEVQTSSADFEFSHITECMALPGDCIEGRFNRHFIVTLLNERGKVCFGSTGSEVEDWDGAPATQLLNAGCDDPYNFILAIVSPKKYIIKEFELLELKDIRGYPKTGKCRLANEYSVLTDPHEQPFSGGKRDLHNSNPQSFGLPLGPEIGFGIASSDLKVVNELNQKISKQGLFDLAKVEFTKKPLPIIKGLALPAEMIYIVDYDSIPGPFFIVTSKQVLAPISSDLCGGPIRAFKLNSQYYLEYGACGCETDACGTGFISLSDISSGRISGNG